MTTETRMGRTPGTEESVRLRATIPLYHSWTDRVRFEGRLVDVDHVWTTAARWYRRGRSERAGWWVNHVGPFVLAERMRG